MSPRRVSGERAVQCLARRSQEEVWPVQMPGAGWGEGSLDSTAPGAALTVPRVRPHQQPHFPVENQQDYRFQP